MNIKDDKRPDEKNARPKRKAVAKSERRKKIITDEQKSKQAIVVTKGTSMECKVRVVESKNLGCYHRYYADFNKDKINDPMKIKFEKYCEWWDCTTKKNCH